MSKENANERISQLVTKLFYVTLTQVACLEKYHEMIMAQRERLNSIVTPSLDDQGLSDLQCEIGKFIGAEHYCELFDASVVAELAKAYADLPTPELGSPDKMLQFQLGILVLRLCSDYADAIDLYQHHTAGFAQQLPRILVRNDVTGEINWIAARDAMITLLEKNFLFRYESAEEKNGDFFRKSKIANEGFVIAWCVIRSAINPILVQPAVSGISFEHDCGDVLQNQGFSVEYTKRSGDFGADIIATKDGLRYAIQCKSGQSPSGVKAVQEAAAGKQHYQTDYAVVVSQSGFTRAAADLAGSMGVALLTFAALTDIEVLARASMRT